MRTPRKSMIAITMALAAFSVTVPSARADDSYKYRAYHDVSGARVWDRLPMHASGLHPMAFSVGRQNGQERWAIFSDNRPGPEWQLTVTARGDAVYQQEFDRFTAMGYQPTMVTATGSGGQDAMFTAIWEKKTGKFFARHGSNTTGFNLADVQARRDGYIPISVNMYGTPPNPRFAAVWADNPSRVTWTVTTSIPASEYQGVFDVQVKAGYRPSAIAVGPNGKSYTTVWRNDKIGNWSAFHGMSAAQYQARFDEMTAKGLYPTWIDMENGVYAAIFTTR
ncbi:hypothetical protein ACQP1V_19840 [Microtetraspora malaysiensis]|uniref:hypothetical protein n=1 Tax=Microtetraspora malaysiensis TaxID=161358 RepID=UPI003D8E30C4